MNVPLQLSGLFPIGDDGFQQALVLDSAGVFVLFRNGLSEPLFADWATQMDAGILAAYKRYPTATHFSYQPVTASGSASLLIEAKTKYHL
jgi:hypothetical protein